MYKGYTSLGKTTDTRPNPALIKKSLQYSIIEKEKGQEKERKTIAEKEVEGGDDFWPAYMLADWSLERAGRSVLVSFCLSVCLSVCLSHLRSAGFRSNVLCTSSILNDQIR